MDQGNLITSYGKCLGVARMGRKRAPTADEPQEPPETRAAKGRTNSNGDNSR